MKRLVTKVAALILLALVLGLTACGGGGDGGNGQEGGGPEGFSPIPPFGGPTGGDPEERTLYSTGNFTLPGGAQFADLRGGGVGKRYVYVADMNALYCFDLLGNLVNIAVGASAGWDTIQDVAVLPPDPFPEDGDDTEYPFPDYPVIAVNQFDTGQWGGIAVIYAPNLDDQVTVEDRATPDGLKFYPLPRIQDYATYTTYPCTPLPTPPACYLDLMRTHGMDVTREGTIAIILDIDNTCTPVSPDYPQSLVFFDPQDGYLIAPRLGSTIRLGEDEDTMRTIDAPFFWRGYDDAVGACSHLAIADKYPQSRVGPQRLYVLDYIMETDYVGFSSITVDMTEVPFNYTVRGLLDTTYGYSPIIGLPAGALPGSFSWSPPYNPDGGLEDPDLTQGGPSGMGIDPRTDELYVCDPGNRRVQVFNTEGYYVKQIGDGIRGAAGNHLVAPSEVTIGLDGTVFVCDTYGGDDAAGLLRVFPSAPAPYDFGSVGGFVYNAGLEPRVGMAGALVSIMNVNGPIDSVETNINGEYRFEDLPLGMYHLVATKTNFSTDHTSLELINDETVMISFNLYPREPHTIGNYVGAVYDDVTRLPIPEVTVRILPTSMTRTTDQYGKFNFDDILAGDYQAEFTHRYYATVTKDVHIVAGQTTNDYTIYMIPLPPE